LIVSSCRYRHVRNLSLLVGDDNMTAISIGNITIVLNKRDKAEINHLLSELFTSEAYFQLDCVTVCTLLRDE